MAFAQQRLVLDGLVHHGRGPVPLMQATASNTYGVGGAWVRGAFWNGSGYEYTDWAGASQYSRFINGGSLGGSGAPCVMF